jgi:hypothetical protein
MPSLFAFVHEIASSVEQRKVVHEVDISWFGCDLETMFFCQLAY